MTAMTALKRFPVPPAFVRAWDRMSSRERGLAIAAIAAVLLAAAWSMVWQPMQDDTLRMQRDLSRNHAVLVAARAQVTEIAGLQRGAQLQYGGDSRKAIERVLGERGMLGALTALDVKETRTTITFAAVSFDALVGMLDELAKTDGLRPVDAMLTSRTDPGTVRAEITLAR